jgi:hypothetical protein
MKKLLRVAALYSTTAACIAQLVGIGYNQSTGHDEFRSIDSSAGTTTLLNSFDFSSGSWNPGTLLSDPSAGTAYAVSGDNNIYTFSLFSGVILATRTLPATIQAIGPDVGSQLVGIDYNQSTSHNEFRSINATAGTTAVLNSFDFSSGSWNPGTFLSDPSAGTAYAVSGDNNIYTFSISSGAILSARALDASVSALGIGLNGELVGLSTSGSPRQFLSINPVNGATTVLNTSNLPSVTDFDTNPAAGTAYALSDKTLYTFDLSSGAVLTTVTLDASIQATEVVPEQNSTLLVSILLSLWIGLRTYLRPRLSA